MTSKLFRHPLDRAERPTEAVYKKWELTARRKAVLQALRDNVFHPSNSASGTPITASQLRAKIGGTNPQSVLLACVRFGWLERTAHKNRAYTSMKQARATKNLWEFRYTMTPAGVNFCHDVGIERTVTIKEMLDFTISLERLFPEHEILNGILKHFVNENKKH